jgi:uncharacterized membrane protein YqaE (UPF0057 family)
MKKLYLSLVTLTFILSSCGGPLSITKRHYNSGFYVETSGRSEHDASTKPKTLARKQESKPISTKLPISSVKTETTVNNTVSASAETKYAGRIPKHIAAVQTPVSKAVTPFAVAGKEKSVSNIFVHSNKNRSMDDHQLLILVLCFLLPPLAVYLKDNDLGLNFWIDLILTLIFWVPGIIFAIIVCFLM